MVPVFKAREIKPTKTVGQRLKGARKKRELTLEQAEQLTKVKLKYLEALEEDRYDLLPTEVYSLGFLRCYSEVLGLNPHRLLDHYRRERHAVDNAKTDSPTILAPARRISAPWLIFTPRTLIILGSLAVVGGLVIYLVSGIQSFLAPPQLKINEPTPNSRVTAQTVTVRGQTDPAVALMINTELVVVEPNGQFSREVALAPGLNTLELVATNRIGKETRAERKILAEYQVEPSPALSPSPFAAVNSQSSPEATVKPSPSPTPTIQPKE